MTWTTMNIQNDNQNKPTIKKGIITTWTGFHLAFPFLLQESCLVLCRGIVTKAGLLCESCLFFLFCSHQIIVHNFRERMMETSWNLVWLLDDACPVSLLKTASTCARAFIPVLSINYEQSKILWTLNCFIRDVSALE